MVLLKRSTSLFGVYCLKAQTRITFWFLLPQSPDEIAPLLSCRREIPGRSRVQRVLLAKLPQRRVSTMFSIVLLSLMVKSHVIQLEDTKFLVQLNIFFEPKYAAAAAILGTFPCS